MAEREHLGARAGWNVIDNLKRGHVNHVDHIVITASH